MASDNFLDEENEDKRPIMPSVEYQGPHSTPLTPFWRRRTLLYLIAILTVLNLVQIYNATHSRSLFFPNHSNSDGSDANLAPAKAVVLASFKTQDVTWTSRLPEDWRVYRYLLDDATPMLHGTPRERESASIAESVHNYTLTTPGNKGREAMAYLTFIIDHYTNLPLFTVFMHGHERSWHQVERADLKIRALNFTAVAEDGYSNIRCTEIPQCVPGHHLDLTKGPDAIPVPALKVLPAFWRLVFPDGPAPPSKLGVVGTAQFVVSRAAIRARPLEFWKGLRRPLERDHEEVEKLMPELKIGEANQNREREESYNLGRVYEKMWHVFFGKPDYHCFGEMHCREVTFSNAITCDRYIGRNEESQAWQDIKCQVDDAAMARAAETQATAIQEAMARNV